MLFLVVEGHKLGGFVERVFGECDRFFLGGVFQPLPVEV